MACARTLQEKLRLAKEKKDVENLKQAGLCFNCRNRLQGGANHVVHTCELLGLRSMVAMHLLELTSTAETGCKGAQTTSSTRRGAFQRGICRAFRPSPNATLDRRGQLNAGVMFGELRVLLFVLVVCMGGWEWTCE